MLGERLDIRMNMTFPHIPCGSKSPTPSLGGNLVNVVLSLDVMDASGEVQTDVASTMFKTRLDENGNVINTATLDVGYNYEPPEADYCGPCYSGKSPREDGCCNSCQDVRDAYQANGW